MTPVYMPFTYLPPRQARRLAGIVGTVVLYQPLQTRIPETIIQLSAQDLIEIRTPIQGEEDRLQAALAEFMDWARINPARTTPGAGFVAARQGEVPFFDETAVNRIRTEFNRYPSPDHAADSSAAAFSARLFLAVAQENDQAIDLLDSDLDRFHALERNFLAALPDADAAGFNRRGLAGGVWREDQGARLTDQRLRAWAALALADPDLPALLVTTSPAVLETVRETCDDAGKELHQRGALRLAEPGEASPPLLADLLRRESLTAADMDALQATAGDGDAPTAVRVSVYDADCPPADLIRCMAPDAISTDRRSPVDGGRQTRILLVQS